jgi:hypothetical protein
VSEADSLIEATSGTAKTLADDTLRLPVEIAATHAQTAFSLFKSRGTAVALFALGGDSEAIEAATASVQIMAKGHLRLFVDIEPRNAGPAFTAFGTPGTSLALAAIKPEHLRQRVAEAEQRKQQRMETRGGSKAALAAQWCNDPQFQAWLQSNEGTSQFWERAFEHSGPGPRNRTEVAAEVIRRVCGIPSRAALDSEPEAWAVFDAEIRKPFMYWKGLQK